MTEQTTTQATETAQVTTTENTQTTTPVAEVNVDDFYNTVPEPYREKIKAKGFKNVDDVYKSYTHLETLVGKKVTDMSPEDMKSLGVKLGNAPEKPEDYTFKIPEGVDKTKINLFAKEAHKLGMSKESAESIYDWYIQDIETETKLLYTEVENAKKADKEALKKEFGLAYDDKLGVFNKAVETFGGQELKEVLHNYGLETNPAVIKALIKAGSLISEGSTPATKSSGQGITPEEANREIQKLMSDSDWVAIWRNPGHPDNKSVRNQYERLIAAKSGYSL